MARSNAWSSAKSPRTSRSARPTGSAPSPIIMVASSMLGGAAERGRWSPAPAARPATLAPPCAAATCPRQVDRRPAAGACRSSVTTSTGFTHLVGPPPTSSWLEPVAGRRTVSTADFIRILLHACLHLSWSTSRSPNPRSTCCGTAHDAESVPRSSPSGTARSDSGTQSETPSHDREQRCWLHEIADALVALRRQPGRLRKGPRRDLAGRGPRDGCTSRSPSHGTEGRSPIRLL